MGRGGGVLAGAGGDEVLFDYLLNNLSDSKAHGLLLLLL